MSSDIETAWAAFKARPSGDAFTGDSVLLYMATLSGARGPEAINYFLVNSLRKIKITEKVISTVASKDAIMEEVEAKIELKLGGSWVAPGVDEQFVVGQTVDIPLLKSVKFVGDKIQTMRVYHDQASILKQLNLISERSRWPIIAKEQVTAIEHPSKVMFNRYNPEDNYTAAAASENDFRSSSRVTQRPGGKQTFNLFDTEYNGPKSITPSTPKKEPEPEPEAETVSPAKVLSPVSAFVESKPAEYRPSARVSAPPGGKTQIDEPPTPTRTSVRTHTEPDRNVEIENESLTQAGTRSSRTGRGNQSSFTISDGSDGFAVPESTAPKSSRTGRANESSLSLTDGFDENQRITSGQYKSNRSGKANETTFSLTENDAPMEPLVRGPHKSHRSARANESSFSLSDIAPAKEPTDTPAPTRHGIRTNRANESSIDLTSDLPQETQKKKQGPVYKIQNPPGGKSSLDF